ncbi:ATP-binding cassette domain-containing protein [Roseomonas sp. OT10]|uniref:cell division ATP-binding protein FtsE n=1 Tax=Roseomonas cutis TaxID=2897332 RepID=UPI001E561261|nr:ATP-binding cassette domain-containing protein [Roseomonas sp. OT10]UFN47334.1 ATP-binding cassette domain-containing protein [Roseomonas sp. OT10]
MAHPGGMVRFSDAGLRYPDPGGGAGEQALHSLTFTLPEGSFTWLTGESGAGKTTLLRLMQCGLRPTSGEVEVLGTRLSRAPRNALPRLRRRIGSVFQDYRLLPYLSAFDNVALPLRLAGRLESSLRPDVTEILRWVGLEARADALPPQLSGGEQQRVAIARAVVGRPELLVADEPTGNLDSRQARRLLALLTEMNRMGTTVVVATHSEDLVAAFPAPMLVLSRGRLVSYDGPGPEEQAMPAREDRVAGAPGHVPAPPADPPAGHAVSTWPMEEWEDPAPPQPPEDGGWGAAPRDARLPPRPTRPVRPYDPAREVPPPALDPRSPWEDGPDPRHG